MSKLALGLVQPKPKGDYEATKAYEFLNIVTLDGVSYICSERTGAPAGYVPVDERYWQLLTDRGLKGDKGDIGDKGDTGEVTQAEFDALTTLVNTLGGADFSSLQTAILGKADQTALDALATAVGTNTSNINTYETSLSAKADTSTVNNALALKADKSELASYATTAYVNAAVAKTTPTIYTLSSSYFTIQYYKDASNNVVVWLSKTGTAAFSGTIGTLPSGFRPKVSVAQFLSRQAVLSATVETIPSTVTVATTGAITTAALVVGVQTWGLLVFPAA